MIYFAKELNKIKNNPDEWDSISVGVFKIDGSCEVQIGEYKRNYHTNFHTFCPFKQKGKWYALYSPDYTSTRIMELPSCKDIGGEKRDAGGFCPVDYYVPNYFVHEFKLEKDDKEEDRIAHINEMETLKDLKNEKKTIDDLLYYPFGFIAGCIWGDDSSWKIQYIDLSKAYKGKIKIDDRFGYIEMPYKAKRLSECISLETMDYPNDETIMISPIRYYNIKTGKEIKYE